GWDVSLRLGKEEVRVTCEVFDSQGAELFFFFQAEDGIRDWSVTGVQTCALPIFGKPRYVPAEQARRDGEAVEDVVRLVARHLVRSEERRVGEEWRSRRWPDP